MSIRINKYRCIGCRKCMEVCPGSLIKIDINKKAYIKYPKDCWGCASCVKECENQAISLYLGADIGGMGSTLTAKKDGDIVEWQVQKPDGKTYVIDLNIKDSNKY